MTRRRFIRKAAGMSSAAVALGAWRPVSSGSRFSATSTVTQATLDTYETKRLRRTVERLFEGIGGLDDVIRQGDTVGIKINLTGGTASAEGFEQKTGLHPGRTFWTHPEVLRVAGELIRDAGAGKLYVMEAVPDDACVGKYGYAEIIKELGAVFVDLNQTGPYSGYSKFPVGDKAMIYETITENGLVGELDCFVSLAKAKQHMGIGVTHGMKNLIGNMPIPCGLYNDGAWNRVAIHNNEANGDTAMNNLARITLDLVNATPVHVTVNDAIETVTGGEGPWHEALAPVRYNTIVAGKDVVAADAIATQAIGFDPKAADLSRPFTPCLNYLRLAEELGMGVHDPERIRVIDATESKG